MTHDVKRRALMIAAVVVAALGALAIRVVVEGRAALHRGDELLHAGESRAAVVEYEVAARWYLPLAPHVAEAYAQLHALTGGDAPLALAAWRAIRSAARATRSHAGEAADADAAIAKLEADDAERGSGDLAGYRAELARDERAGIPGALLAALGIALWLAGAALLAWHAVNARGLFAPRRALVGGGVLVAGLALWLLGLYNA